MKKIPFLTLLLCMQFFAGTVLLAQVSTEKFQYNNYTILVTGNNGDAIYNAKVVAGSQTFMTNAQGEVIYKNQVNNFISVSAAGYQGKKVDLRQYPQNSVVAVSLLKLADKNSPLIVYVRDEQKKPIPNAVVSVSPGVSGVTDAGGVAHAEHKQMPGEYVTVTVSAAGYKDQQQRVLVGVGQHNALTRADDVAYFIMEKGENDKNVMNIVIEVLDDETNKPVNGAGVTLQLTDGTSQTDYSKGNGETVFSDIEYGYSGSGRIIVKHDDYEEKWSDVSEDLMTAKDQSTRRLTVYITKKEKKIDISGTWNSSLKVVYSISQSGTTYTWSAPQYKETAEGTVIGNKVTANWSGINGKGSATGTIKTDESGKAVKIDWSNGVVFMR